MAFAHIKLSESWIRSRVDLENLDAVDVKFLSLPGTNHQKISSFGSAFSNFKFLKRLDLSCNAIYSLKGLDYLQSLEGLKLYDNDIQTVKELWRLKQNSRLTCVDVRLNPIVKLEPDYHLLLISILPRLTLLDETVVQPRERRAALLKKYDIDPQRPFTGQCTTSQWYDSFNKRDADYERVLLQSTSGSTMANPSYESQVAYNYRSSTPRIQSNHYDSGYQGSSTTARKESIDTAKTLSSSMKCAENSGVRKQFHFANVSGSISNEQLQAVFSENDRLRVELRQLIDQLQNFSSKLRVSENMPAYSRKQLNSKRPPPPQPQPKAKSKAANDCTDLSQQNVFIHGIVNKSKSQSASVGRTKAKSASYLSASSLETMNEQRFTGKALAKAEGWEKLNNYLKSMDDDEKSESSSSNDDREKSHNKVSFSEKNKKSLVNVSAPACCSAPQSDSDDDEPCKYERLIRKRLMQNPSEFKAAMDQAKRSIYRKFGSSVCNIHGKRNYTKNCNFCQIPCPKCCDVVYPVSPKQNYAACEGDGKRTETKSKIAADVEKVSNAETARRQLDKMKHTLDAFRKDGSLIAGEDVKEQQNRQPVVSSSAGDCVKSMATTAHYTKPSARTGVQDSSRCVNLNSWTDNPNDNKWTPARKKSNELL